MIKRDNQNNILVKKKPIKCPVCSFRPVSKIIYGYPIYNERMQQEIQDKKIVLGGCCIEEASWFCTNCKSRFSLKIDLDINLSVK